ncbi:helix-turn-helix transcriptional regulator [Blastomonas sp.]|uniref:helix-turn-helix domain-containing protein n=1 Tax=Blastomonas sp. TaxID=1909299 RepID=UPI0026296F96|nr:helix-turn-helix transcriptional regulator [Blastomonas sp.]MDM7956025.1 helix-turn-helix transcriptional regulator [Blastomonas sp.]
MAKTIFTEDHRSFIAALRDVRREKRVTQETLSRRLGRDQSYISNIERGQRRLDVIEFAEIARALDEKPEELFSAIMATI